jgi:hypothetical protein
MHITIHTAQIAVDTKELKPIHSMLAGYKA